MGTIRSLSAVAAVALLVGACSSSTPTPLPSYGASTSTPVVATATPAGSPTDAPSASPVATATAAGTPNGPLPPIPTKVSMAGITITCPSGMDPCNSYRVRWTQANPAGVSIDVYAVKTCLNPSVDDTKPRVCVLPGMGIPTYSVRKIGTVAAAAGTYTFSLHDGVTYGYGWFDDGVYAYAILVQATNSAGSSSWVIAGSSSKCESCTI